MQMIFITDQKSVINRFFSLFKKNRLQIKFLSPLTLRLVFNLVATDPKNMEEYSTLLKLAFFLVDKLSNYKLSSIVICLLNLFKINCFYEKH